MSDARKIPAPILHLSVVGAGVVGGGIRDLATAVGRAVARAGAVLVCGGLGGVMEAACRGARQEGGRTVALVPGPDPRSANPWAEVVVPTGLGDARNVLVVRAGAAVLALPGSWGTLSEIALARKADRPVVGVGAWGDLEGVVRVDDPVEAVAEAIRRSGWGV